MKYKDFGNPNPPKLGPCDYHMMGNGSTSRTGEAKVVQNLRSHKVLDISANTHPKTLQHAQFIGSAWAMRKRVSGEPPV